MGSDPTEDETLKLTPKKMAFMQLPEVALFFLDKTNDDYFVRIETDELRIVLPIHGDLNLVLGGLVDEFIATIV